jgi:hypothetical protein
LSVSKRILRLVVAIGVLGISGGAASSAAAAQSSGPNASYTTKGAYSYFSAPSLHPPRIAVDRPVTSRKLARGDYFIANFKDLTQTKPMVGEGGPLILDNHLQPVWFNPVCVKGCGSKDLFSLNLHLQFLNGKPALSWWQGALNPVGNPTAGTDIVVDQHYRQVAKLTGTAPWVISEHEFIISGPNAWVTAYRTIPMDLSGFGGSATGTLYDSAVQEYNLKTGQLLYTWDAKDHVPLSDSMTTPDPTGVMPWDAYHINSVNLTGNGTFLVSLRNTWAAYLIQRSTGTPVWTLGGKHSTFTFGPNASFEWQHDVEMHPGNVISLFNNACCAITGIKNGVAQFGKPAGPTRGMVLQLDLTKHTATLANQFTRGKSFNAAFVGDTQLLSGGNAVLGWGSRPFFTEFDKSGHILLDAVLPGPNLSYRALKYRWTGTPFFPPSGAARTRHGHTTVYASWDGATLVTGWKVLAGSSAKHLHTVARVSRSGFETAIPLTGSFKVYKVQALNSRGHVLRTSRAFRVKKPGSSNSSGPGFY